MADKHLGCSTKRVDEEAKGRSGSNWLVLGDTSLWALAPISGTDSMLNIKAQEGEELVVEGHCNAHVFDGDLYMVNDWFHGGENTSRWGRHRQY